MLGVNGCFGSRAFHSDLVTQLMFSQSGAIVKKHVENYSIFLLFRSKSKTVNYAIHPGFGSAGPGVVVVGGGGGGAGGRQHRICCPR